MISCDQLGSEVKLEKPPKRVVSLVPSITEYLVDLGVEVVGRTKFCVHPAREVKQIPIIGGTKNFRFEVIEDLAPDIVIGNKEENYKEGILHLSRSFPVWMSHVVSLGDMYALMRMLGEVFELQSVAMKMVDQVKSRLDRLHLTRSGSVMYLIWKKPWLVAGRGTFIDSFLEYLGYENVIKTDRYPEVSPEEIGQLNPSKILLSSEPYPFKERDIREMKEMAPDAEISLVNGEAYSWYGSRLLKIYP